MRNTGTVLAGMARDGRGAPRLALDDAPRVMALLATAYGRPVAPYVVAKLRRAAELWTEGKKALAHIHLAYADLPPCGEDEALRLFLAEVCLAVAVTPAELMKAQGFNPALSKYNPDQPRVPAGSGRESGRWTSGGAGGGQSPADPRVYVVTAGISWAQIRNLIQQLVQAWRRFHPEGEAPGETTVKPESEPVPTLKAPAEEGSAAPTVKPFGSLEEDLPRPGYGEEVQIPGLPATIRGINTTKRTATVRNCDVDLSRSEFEDELSRSGWTKEPSKDGEAMN